MNLFEKIVARIQHPVVSATATILLLAVVGYQQKYAGPVSWGQHILVDAAFPIITIICFLLGKAPALIKRLKVGGES